MKRPLFIRYLFLELIIVLFIFGIMLAINCKTSLHYGNMSRSWAIESLGWPLPVANRVILLADENKELSVRERRAINAEPLQWNILNAVVDFGLILISTGIFIVTKRRLLR